MIYVRVAALVLAFAAAALAEARSPASGIEIPVTSFALVDDATALSANPAGLAFVSGLAFDYANEVPLRSSVGRADGLFLGLGAGPIAIGSSIEWLHSGSQCTPSTPCRRRFTLGGAFRLGVLSLGALHHGSSSDESAVLDHLGSWDFGAMLRPVGWLSLGYS